MRYNKYDNNRQPNRVHLAPHNPSFQDSFDVSSHMHSISEDHEDELTFLKDKLIQTHQKFMRELEKNQIMEERLDNCNRDNMSLREQVSQLKAKVATYDRIEKQHQNSTNQYQEKFKSVENRYLESQKKSQFLRSDLDGMRNKMLQVLGEKNQLEEACKEMKVMQQKQKDRFESIFSDLREKDDEISYLNKQISALKATNSQAEHEIESLQDEVHRLNTLMASKSNTEAELDSQLRKQRDQNSQILQQMMTIQSEHKIAMNKITELEEQIRALKDELYWLQNNKEQDFIKMKEELQKYKQELNTMQSLYKQKEKQFDILRKKPFEDAEKKRKNYEHTREFVKTLETQQTQRVKKRQNQKGNLFATNQSSYANNQFKSQSKSPSYNSNSKQKSPKKQNANENKGKFISMLGQVEQLENALISSQMERKKIVSEIDRIDDTKIKTRDIIGKRRRLEEQLAYQQSKIEKIKTELKKKKVM